LPRGDIRCIAEYKTWHIPLVLLVFPMFCFIIANVSWSRRITWFVADRPDSSLTNTVHITKKTWQSNKMTVLWTIHAAFISHQMTSLNLCRTFLMCAKLFFYQLSDDTHTISCQFCETSFRSNCRLPVLKNKLWSLHFIF
jgi:hypothetical protein